MKNIIQIHNTLNTKLLTSWHGICSLSNQENGVTINFSFLTAEELSGILRIPKTTLYTLSQRGKIPAVKIGKHWRYIKEEILGWLERNNRHNGYENHI